MKSFFGIVNILCALGTRAEASAGGTLTVVQHMAV
jgi:hypothetical protein